MKKKAIKHIVMLIAVIFCICVSMSAVVYADSLAEEVEMDFYDAGNEEIYTDNIDEGDYVYEDDNWTEGDEDYEVSGEDVLDRTKEAEEENCCPPS